MITELYKEAYKQAKGNEPCDTSKAIAKHVRELIEAGYSEPAAYDTAYNDWKEQANQARSDVIKELQDWQEKQEAEKQEAEKQLRIRRAEGSGLQGYQKAMSKLESDGRTIEPKHSSSNPNHIPHLHKARKRKRNK
jgi:type I site-specific restriction-modification system R (restriction) subunit